MGLEELEAYFLSAVIPEYPIKINSYSIVGPNFLSSQIEAAKAGNKSAKLRLEQFREYLEAQK